MTGPVFLDIETGVLLCPRFFQLFFEGCDSDFQTGLVLLGLVEQTSCLVQLRLVHGFDL